MKSSPSTITRFLVIGALLCAAIVLSWHLAAALGVPDPTAAHTSLGSAVIDIGVLVFREGLKCILVHPAITASMTGAQSGQKKPVAAGAGMGALATLITWFVAVRRVLGRYGIERFLYRLGQSSHRDRFALKGATLFTLWTGKTHQRSRSAGMGVFRDR